jgi:hypothetical protein
MSRILPLVVLLIYSTAYAEEDERYYVIVFSSKSRLNKPNDAHIWATLIKTSTKDSQIRVEEQTISWVPASLKVRLLAMRSEEGANIGLMPTIDHYQLLGCKITAWGPYELASDFGPEFYQRFSKQKARLERGEVRYKALDPDIGRRSAFISNCIHVLTDLDPYRRRNAYSEFLRFGDRASEHIVETLAERGRIDRDTTHVWLMDTLGLSDKCISIRK